MSDISDDQKCKKIDSMLDEYAENVRRWTIEKSYYVRKGYGNKFQYAKEYPHPYGNEDDQKIIKDKIDNEINDYVCSFEGTERALVNNYFLCKFKEYFSYPIAEYAIDLAVKAITERPLLDEDKIEFLKELFGNRYKKNGRKSKQLFCRFDETVILKLMDFNPNNNLAAVDDLYNELSGFLGEPKRKNDRKIKLLYNMFNVFIKNAQKVSPEAVVNYAEIYFNMAERTNERLDAGILERLAVKTPYALERAEMCGDKEVLDKKAIKEIFKAYVGYANRQGKFNQNLGMEMTALAQNLFSGYGYTVKEAKDLTDILHFKDKDENGKKIRENMVNKALDSMASALDKYIDNAAPMQKSLLKDVDKENPRISHARVVDYADRLFAFAAKNPEKDIWLNTLANMLTNGEKFDKNLVLDVVDAYGQSVSGRDIDQMNYNQILHHKMTRLLQGIAVKYDYLPNDMDELCRHIEKGADGHDEFVEIGRVVKAKWVQVGDWRYESSQRPVIPAIIHKKGGNSL